MTTYAAIDREAIWAALLTKLKAALGSQFLTIGRKHRMPPDLTPAQQPALFVCQVQEGHAPAPRGLTGKLTLHGYLFIYCYESAAMEVAGQETNLAATQLNGLFKAIDDALAPSEANGTQTLGGLVSHCWVEGNTDQDPGIIGEQAFAAVPIHMLVP